MRSASGTFHTSTPLLTTATSWGPHRPGSCPCRRHCFSMSRRAHQPGPPCPACLACQGLQGCPSPRRSLNSPAIDVYLHLQAAVAGLAHVLDVLLLCPALNGAWDVGRGTGGLGDWVGRYPISLLWSAQPSAILTGQGPLGHPCHRSSVLGLTCPAALSCPRHGISRFPPIPSPSPNAAAVAVAVAVAAAAGTGTGTADSDLVADADCRFGRLAAPNGTCSCDSAAGSGVLMLAATCRLSPRQSVRGQKSSHFITPRGVPAPCCWLAS